jgi:hypothetical protein
MGKYLIILVILVVVSFVAVPVLSFAQTEKELEQAKEWLGTWKRNFASPTYGLALFKARLEGGWYGQPDAIPDEQREFPATAMDFRIFRGVNVSKRGGFYTGIEAGVLFLSPFAEITFDEPTIGEMHLTYNGGLVFLMAKYGIRMDIGLAIFGVSLGAEMGMGGTLFAGGFEFYTGSREDREAEYGFGSSQANMGLIMDVAAEAALRIGKNFRLVAKGGFMAAPIAVPESRGWEEYTVYYDGSKTVVEKPWGEITDTEDYKRGVMAQYGVNIDAFCLDFRVGFILNFQD